MAGWRKRYFNAGFHAIRATHADQWLRTALRGVGIVLTLHRVRPWREQSFAPNRSLEVTPQFLNGVIELLNEHGFEILPLDEVPARLESKRPKRPFAVLTFDDGYRDTLEYAWPILKRHGLPWSIFIVPDFADRRGQLWWLELEESIAKLDIVDVTIGNNRTVCETRSAHQKSSAYQHLCQALRAGPD